MMKYSHSFLVRAPIERVADFYMNPANMAVITPPPVHIRTHHSPAGITNGAYTAFTLWLGPLPVYWVAEFDQVSSWGFVDRQRQGPFGLWVHRHSFEPAGMDETIVRDEIVAELGPHPLLRWVGLGMWLSQPVLFAYREWKTKQILEEPSAQRKVRIFS